jgi:hypothetical protein
MMTRHPLSFARGLARHGQRVHFLVRVPDRSHRRSSQPVLRPGVFPDPASRFRSGLVDDPARDRPRAAPSPERPRTAALAAYRGVEYMESTQFCGQVCHTVMEPEFAAYREGPHSRVARVECHVGSGAARPAIRTTASRGGAGDQLSGSRDRGAGDRSAVCAVFTARSTPRC